MRSAVANADAAATAAEEAAGYADAAGAHSATAREAAAQARRHADEANRAAYAAEALARRSATAAFEARAAANSAADHAEKAAVAAEEAAAHAGEAQDAAAEATRQATEARKAADTATAAVTTAQSVYDLARETETEDLATRTAAAIERAKDQKKADDEFTASLGRILKEAQELDAEGDRLTAEAAKPDVDIAATVAAGRKYALKVLQTRGPWSQEAAELALSGDNSAMLEYLRTGREQAEREDARERVSTMSFEAPYEAVRIAATEALKGDDQAISEFLKAGQYEAARTDNRIAVTQIHSTGAPGVKEAAEAALNNDSANALAGRGIRSPGSRVCGHRPQRCRGGRP